MATKTGIEWTDYSINPIKYRDASGRAVWACVKTSPGCYACYSEALAHRFKRGGPFSLPVLSKLTPFLDEKDVKFLLQSKTISGKRVFPCDMTDFAGEWIPDEILDQLFTVFALRQDVEFQLLTKRAERLAEYIDRLTGNDGPDPIRWDRARRPLYDAASGRLRERIGVMGVYPRWPLPNILLGFSAENQEWYDKRLPYMRQLAAMGWRTWWSLEPLIGPIQLAGDDPACWAVVGGESGPKARPCDIDWIRSIVRQCRESNTPVFVKQLGSDPRWKKNWCGEDNPPSVDESIRKTLRWIGKTEAEIDAQLASVDSLPPMRLVDRKGGDINEWPEDLRVRQFPKERV